MKKLQKFIGLFLTQSIIIPFLWALYIAGLSWGFWRSYGIHQQIKRWLYGKYIEIVEGDLDIRKFSNT